VPGADKLVQARDNFATNIRRIEEFADRSLTREFDVANVTKLVPEEVLTKLKKLPESQRNFLVDVMQKHPNPQVNLVLDTIRRSTMDDILVSGRTSGSALDPKISIAKTLRALKKKGDLAALFPNPADLQEAQLAIKYMQRVLAKEAPAGTPGIGAGTAYSASRGAGATATQGLVAKELESFVTATLMSPEALSKVLFQGDNRKLLLDLAKGKTKGEKAYIAVRKLGEGLAITGARGGPMVGTERPEVEGEGAMAPAPSAGPSMQEIEQEMRDRGLLEE